MRLFVCPVSTFLSCRKTKCSKKSQDVFLRHCWPFITIVSWQSVLTVWRGILFTVFVKVLSVNYRKQPALVYDCMSYELQVLSLRHHQERAALQVRGFFLGSLKYFDTFRSQSKWGQVKRASGISFFNYLGKMWSEEGVTANTFLPGFRLKPAEEAPEEAGSTAQLSPGTKTDFFSKRSKKKRS